MNTLALPFIHIILIGLGATLTFDLWVLFLKHAFGIPPSNICLVGRWLRTMPEGTFRHANILSAPKKSAECRVGWIAHYTIGVMFAIVFAVFVGNGWFQQPTPIPAISFGIVTVLAPFFIMQPSFGFGFAAAKTSNPTQARVRSLMNHTAFGAGLYLLGVFKISYEMWHTTSVEQPTTQTGGTPCLQRQKPLNKSFKSSLNRC